MTPAEYLDAAKSRLCLSSDYELAKKLELNRAHIPEIRNGKRAVPPHLALSLAVTLELDPARVVFDLEAQREKNEKRRELYRSFLSRASSAIILLCTLVSITFAGLLNDPGARGGSPEPA
jgi:plasmid maintenance system antidote protein VapI